MPATADLVALLTALASCPPADVPGLAGVVADALTDDGRERDARWLRGHQVREAVGKWWLSSPGGWTNPHPTREAALGEWQRRIVARLTAPCPRCRIPGFTARLGCEQCHGAGFVLRP